jgi:uncharacterized membrane protein YphA (DoxX/SURF4 family)
MTSSNARVFRGIRLVLRLVLGLVFVYAAWVKLFGTQWSWPPRLEPWELFALAISSYDILPLKWVELVARTLPWMELALGAMLLAGRGLRIAATVTSMLLLVFFGLMVRAFAQGKEISCGCFGPGEIISWWTLLRDGSMLAGAVVLTWIAFQRQRQVV